MALESLTAKGNTGAGTDQLAGVTTAGGFAGAAALVDDTGTLIGAANPLPVGVAGVATETTLEAARALLAAVVAALKGEDTAHTSGDLGLPALAIRSSTDAVTTDSDGDYTLLKVDEEGRLKVASKPASYADITGDITAVHDWNRAGADNWHG